MDFRQENVEFEAWARTRESLVSWVAKWGAESGIKELLSWRGFSLWWCSNLVHKDAELNNEWFISLHKRLRGIKCGGVMPVTNYSILKFSKIFLIMFLKWILVRMLFPTQKLYSKREIVWFSSLSSNLIFGDGIAYDRLFDKAPLMENQSGLESAYIVMLLPGKRDFIHPIVYRRKILRMLSMLQRQVVILNSYVPLIDLLAVHFASYRAWSRFRRVAKGIAFQKGVEIEGIPCDDILLGELENSFGGAIQWNLLYGLSFQRWLSFFPTPQTIVTYAETGAYMRPAYHFGKQANSRNMFVSIQHAKFSKNGLFLYHRAAEFEQNGLWDGVQYSPMPDYYFIQGQHFLRALGKYYPSDRIRLIGCLKYDKYIELLANANKYVAECRRKISYCNKKLIVIAPSINDFSDILGVLGDINIGEEWMIILSPHPFLSISYFRKILGRHQLRSNIMIADGIETCKLLVCADLVICGKSSVALEAHIFGVPSVRLVSSSTQPHFDEEPEIPCFINREDFWSWFHLNFESQSPYEKIKTGSNRLIEDFLYRIDGNAAGRMWNELEIIKRSERSLEMAS
jgi:hypothetical protein